jgi:hypothetical protein
MNEIPIFNKLGKSVYRLCGPVFFDYLGKPRGFLVGKTVYDLAGQHRGFYIHHILWDRMGRILGFAPDASFNSLILPTPDIPPVPFKNLAAPEVPTNLADLPQPSLLPGWSMMRLENLLVLMATSPITAPAARPVSVALDLSPTA